MNTLTAPLEPGRLDELLADRALDAVDVGDAAELHAMIDALIAQHEGVPSSLDVTAGLAAAAMLSASDVGAMPDGLRQRLEASGAEWCAGVSQRSRAERGPIPFAGGSRPLFRALPWLAAAAGIVLAVIAWMPRASGVNPWDSRQQLLANAGDVVTLAWKDWDAPEVAGVRGDVVWSESAQKGYMRFTNLPVKDSNAEQYQLWIVDSRGMEQRISGGIFNGGSSEVVVPIEPGITVRGAAAFAVTVEKPGGTWVSDMSRRVVIAAK